MAGLRAALLVLGLLATLVGLLWIIQGLGVSIWSDWSYMLANRRWAMNGAALAGLGIAALLLSRRGR
jgi:hypothetical protein